MTDSSDKRLFLIVILVFGVVATAAGFNWLSSGQIAIRQGGTRIGVGGGLPPPVPQAHTRVAGVIGNHHVLYYPLCGAWIALGLSMVVLPVLGYFSSNEMFLKLSAYSGPAILLLAAVTVIAALWSGP